MSRYGDAGGRIWVEDEIWLISAAQRKILARSDAATPSTFAFSLTPALFLPIPCSRTERTKVQRIGRADTSADRQRREGARRICALLRRPTSSPRGAVLCLLPDGAQRRARVGAWRSGGCRKEAQRSDTENSSSKRENKREDESTDSDPYCGFIATFHSLHATRPGNRCTSLECSCRLLDGRFTPRNPNFGQCGRISTIDVFATHCAVGEEYLQHKNNLSKQVVELRLVQTLILTKTIHFHVSPQDSFRARQTAMMCCGVVLVIY